MLRDRVGDGPARGVKIPPLPTAPDLSRVKFGEPVELFNGKDLSGWRLMGDKGSNSGIYLRGTYEVKVFDSYGEPLDPHNMGAFYSRLPRCFPFRL